MTTTQTPRTSTTAPALEAALGDPLYDQEALAVGIFRPSSLQGCGTCGCSGRVVYPPTGRSTVCPACAGAGSR